MSPTKKISEHCRAEHCIPKLESETKDQVIAELLQTFVVSGALPDSAVPALLGMILAREEEGTTGIGKGVAMPHARNAPDVDETLIAVGLHQAGVDWEATDGAPVHVVFLIVASDPEEYLGVAGRVARVARDDVEMRALERQTTAKKIRRFLEESWQ